VLHFSLLTCKIYRIICESVTTTVTICSISGITLGSQAPFLAESALRLGLSRFEFDDFLIKRNVCDHAYSVADLEQDLKDLEKLRAQGLLPK